MKNKIVATTILFAACLSIAACGNSEATAEKPEILGIPGMEITNGQMVLNAVEDRPAAVYFSLSYDGDRGLAIRKAEVEGAESAMLHEYADNQGRREMMEALPITLSKGTKLEFEPGSRHVMAKGLSPEIVAGGKTNVTLTVAGGDTITFPVDVVAAGDADR